MSERLIFILMLIAVVAVKFNDAPGSLLDLLRVLWRLLTQPW